MAGKVANSAIRTRRWEKKHRKFFKSLRSGIGARFSSHFPILFEESEDHWDHDQLQAMASKSKRLGSFFGRSSRGKFLGPDEKPWDLVYLIEYKYMKGGFSLSHGIYCNYHGTIYPIVSKPMNISNHSNVWKSVLHFRHRKKVTSSWSPPSAAARPRKWWSWWRGDGENCTEVPNERWSEKNPWDFPWCDGIP